VSPKFLPGLTPPPGEGPEDDVHLSLREHLIELRKRLKWAVIWAGVGFCGCYYWSQQIFHFMMRPVLAALPEGEKALHFSSSVDPFIIYLKVGMYAGIFAASPFIFYQLWLFIAPGLYRRERRMVLGITIATAGCFIGGAIFGYTILCTPALTYMFSFAEKFNGFEIQPTIMMDELVGFMLAMLLGTAVAFELPVVLAVLGWIGLVSARQLWKFDKYALILSAVVGGVLTPGPDVLSQVLMAGPLFGLYNLSILIVWFIERARKKTMDDLDKGDPEPPSQALIPSGESPS
jgi:sec-independent protein translocase protein TatC